MKGVPDESYTSRKEPLHVPSLEEVKTSIANALSKDYKFSSVEIQQCPDLTKWGLLNKGLSGENILVDIGGEPFAHNPLYRNVRFDTREIAIQCGMGKSFMLGAGCCCTKSLAGHQGELMLIADVEKGKNASISARVLSDRSCCCSKYDSLYYGGLGNLHLTDGENGQVIKVTAKQRINEEKSLPLTIKHGLNDHFKAPVGMGGVFKVLKGKVRTHIQPDYVDCPDGYYNVEEEKSVKPFLQMYEGPTAMGPDIVCLSTFWTSDPTHGAMHLRSSGEHTHLFSIDGKQGGHYHGDEIGEDIEYEGYFVVASSIVKVRDAVSEAMADKWKTPTVAVVGAGAMGCLFGGLLFQGGLDVTLIDTWKEHVDSINVRGLQLCGVGGDRDLKIKATSDISSVGKVDVVIIQCKSADTRQATSSAKHMFHKDTVAISFQNGLGNEDVMAEVLGGDQWIFGGQTLQGASVVEAGKVRIHTDLASYIGEWKGGFSNRCARLCHIFTKAGLLTMEDVNMKKRKWMKAIYNCVVSPLSTLTNLTHRDIYCRKGSIDIANIIISEALNVARKEGLAISEAESKECLQKVIDSNQANKSSMCYDILNKKKSEMDFINGRIVALAGKHGIPVPFNESMVFFVKALESHYVDE